MTRVVKSHRVSSMGTQGLSVTAPGAFKMWVSLHCLINLSVENRKKKMLSASRMKGKNSQGTKRKDRKADDLDI